MSAANGGWHKCGWPKCDVPVPAWKWGCAAHFAQLPAEHRDALQAFGNKTPEGRSARRRAASWARRNEGTVARVVAATIRQSARKAAEACRRCGGPPSPRLARYCVQCHVADMLGEKD